MTTPALQKKKHLVAVTVNKRAHIGDNSIRLKQK